MGYRTYYSLTIEALEDGVTLEEERQIKIMQLFLKTFDMHGFISDEGYAEDECKWYEHDDDMKKFSKLFPDVIFTLHGEGEESGDIWDTYYVNGKMQHSPAIVTFEPFDPKKLE